MMLAVGWAVRRAAVEVEWWLRPYDSMADQRRWRWEARTPCGLSADDQRAVAALLEQHYRDREM